MKNMPPTPEKNEGGYLEGGRGVSFQYFDPGGGVPLQFFAPRGEGPVAQCVHGVP